MKDTSESEKTFRPSVWKAIKDTSEKTFMPTACFISEVCAGSWGKGDEESDDHLPQGLMGRVRREVTK